MKKWKMVAAHIRAIYKYTFVKKLNIESEYINNDYVKVHVPAQQRVYELDLNALKLYKKLYTKLNKRSLKVTGADLPKTIYESNVVFSSIPKKYLKEITSPTTISILRPED